VSSGYTLQTHPFIVPTEDGKLIEEHFGNASLGGGGVSIARMVAPAGWSEPPQTPEFDEYTLVIRGRKEVTVNGERIVLKAGESILVEAGSKVRYANPFEDETEYVSVCMPAFSPDAVHRE
jgi:mannose-6-phosphate isomerase-like protein (cupin superfamily)